MVKLFLFSLVLAAPLLFPQRMYNYIGHSSSKLVIPQNAQINKDGNQTVYAWFNEKGFYFFLAKNGIIVTARRDLLVASENEAAQLWATVVEEIMADGFYPIKTDIGDSTLKNSKGITATVWWGWNDDQLMYAVVANFE